MFYSQFSKQINGDNFIRSYGKVIREQEGNVYVDGQLTKFKSLEEARQYVISNTLSTKLEEQISKESYEDLSENKIASIIKEHHEVKVTDTLIENYIKLASSNMFSIDPVIFQIRKLNTLDKIVEGKLHYVLNDDSVVAIDYRTQLQLNNILTGHSDVVEYMRESKENFLHVLEQIEE